MAAAREGHGDVVQALLAKGAEVNAAAKGGLTALMTASFRGDRDVVQALLAKGPTSTPRGATDRPRWMRRRWVGTPISEPY